VLISLTRLNTSNFNFVSNNFLSAFYTTTKKIHTIQKSEIWHIYVFFSFPIWVCYQVSRNMRVPCRYTIVIKCQAYFLCQYPYSVSSQVPRQRWSPQLKERAHGNVLPGQGYRSMEQWSNVDSKGKPKQLCKYPAPALLGPPRVSHEASHTLNPRLRGRKAASNRKSWNRRREWNCNCGVKKNSYVWTCSIKCFLPRYVNMLRVLSLSLSQKTWDWARSVGAVRGWSELLVNLWLSSLFTSCCVSWLMVFGRQHSK
jgi:hypothetical protein